MLRRRSKGVARFSQHMQGHAMDFFIPGVPLEQIRFAGLRLQRGGVGFYPTSGSPFVHLDVGSIRHWPRMTHDQLARVFPDGRTVHVPTDGKPLKGYELALADIQRRGNGEDVAAPSKSRSFLASLFGRNKSADDDEESTNDAVASGGKVMPVALAAADTAKATVTAAAEKLLERVPLPRAKTGRRRELSGRLGGFQDRCPCQAATSAQAHSRRRIYAAVAGRHHQRARLLG